MKIDLIFPLLFIVPCVAFSFRNIRCPYQSEWRIRSSFVCNSTDTKNYTCLYNAIKRSYEESCKFKPVISEIGSQYVISVYPNSEPCRHHDRYQPFPLGSNFSHDCVFQKSSCREEGQILFHHGSPKKDLTCRCNFQNGYGFINEIPRKCNCIPSKEDCSCYMKNNQCLPGHKLISDYICLHKDNKYHIQKCPDMGPEFSRKETQSSQHHYRKEPTNIDLLNRRSEVIVLTILSFSCIVYAFFAILLITAKKIPDFCSIDICPYNLNTTREGGRLCISWSKPDKVPYIDILHYNLYNTFNEERIVFKVTGDKRYVLKDLLPSTDYSFRVSVSLTNSIESKCTQEIKFNPGLPEKPICSSPYGDNGSIVLLWDSPKDTLIKLDEYVIQISTDEWNTFKEISKHSQTGVLKHEIQNAIEGLIYRFNIYSCSNSVRSQAQTLEPFPARHDTLRSIVKFEANSQTDPDLVEKDAGEALKKASNGIPVHTSKRDGSIIVDIIFISDGCCNEKLLYETLKTAFQKEMTGAYTIKFTNLWLERLNNPSPPQQVTISRINNGVLVSWNEPSRTFFKTKEYAVEYTQDNWNSKDEVTVPANNKSLTIWNVLPFAKIQVKVYTCICHQIRSSSSLEISIDTEDFSVMTSKEDENFLRIVYLHYRVVSPCLTRFFDGIHPNLSASVNLAPNKKYLRQLQRKRILNQQQWDTLYPSSGTITSADLDVTLMVCLLRNISPAVKPPANGFDQLPLDSELSHGAHLARIKYYKNYLVSHSSNGTINNHDFEQIWAELEKAIIGIGNTEDVDHANLAKVKVLNSSITTLLSTELQNDKKISNLQDTLEIVRCTQVEIQTAYRSLEERIKTTDEKSQIIYEGCQGNSNQTQDRIANIEKNITEFQNYKTLLSESTCDEIQKNMSEQEKRQAALEMKADNNVKSLEDIKTTTSRPERIIGRMQKWKTADEYFVKTRASDHVMSCILRNNCVSIVGPSGVGKTFLLQHVALEMEKIGYTIISVNGPHEIKEHYKINRKTLFVIDDICGNFTAKTIRLDEWKKTMKYITYIIEGSCKFMLTCRLQVFQDEGFEHSDLSLFKSCVCNLIEKQLALTYLDKERLAKMYFKNTYTNPQLRLDIRCLYQYNFFPLLCKLYDSQKDQSNFCMERFVKNPFNYYEKELDNLYVDCKEGKFKFIALLFLVVCNNHLDKNMIKEKLTDINKLLNDIREHCGLHDSLTVKSLILELDTMTGTFVLNEQDVYHTIHDKLFDLLFLYFGTKNDITEIEFTELMITHADKNFIGERFSISNTGPSKEGEFQYSITIQDSYLPRYIERVFDDMTKSDDIYEYMGNNRNVSNENFLPNLSTFMKQFDKTKKETLIQNASIVFLRDVFVMNELDVNTFPAIPKEAYSWKYWCHIVLDHDLVQMYIQRIFYGMTESKDVTEYINCCRCCANEAFHAALLTFMTNLKPSSIRDIIRNASTSFVQSMLVISKEDINDKSSSIHERYGIEIPDDLIPLYIEKVFDGIEKCFLVDMYMRQNRNRNNVLFHVILSAYMSHLDGSKIKKIIENSSQDCIDSLCMTNDDSKENSQLKFDCGESIILRPKTKTYEYKQRLSHPQFAKVKEDTKVTRFDRVHVMETIWDKKPYGIVIPADYIPLYIRRWFDGLKKSKNIENYISRNRNKETTQFQTSLLNMMTSLNEDDIRTLIQTTTNDFLHKVLVTTEDHIGYDKCSSKMYHRYGIVIPEQYLDMYTYRILNLIKRPESFINDMKGNRSLRTVLKCMRQLDISKIAELIDTAKDEVFHRMITVDVEDKVRLERDWPYNFDDLGTKFEINEAYITCPFSLVDKYMNRMISDWGKGSFDLVIKNINLKNKSFVETFSAHLNTLEATQKYELLYIRNYRSKQALGNGQTALTLSCEYGDMNLAKWCLQNYSREHPNEEHRILCALFLLVIFNNQLEAPTLIDESAVVHECILKFKDLHDIPEAMSAVSIKEKLDTSLNGIVVKEEGFYSVKHSEVFQFLVFYFSSFENATNILIENASVKIVCEQFLIGKKYTQHFLINLDVKQSQRCIERVFAEMTKSDHLLRYVLQGNTNLNKKPIFEYMKNLNKEDIKTVIKYSCIDFINNFLVLENDETKHNINAEIEPCIAVPEHLIPVYIHRFFELTAKSNCVAGCFQENRNRKNVNFTNRLLIYMIAINRHDVENLIEKASSDFISRMLVISKDDIKPKSYWEYECYGIVVPADLLQMYMERVFKDFTNCDYVYINRNSGNSTFRDLLHSHASSICGDKLSTLIQTGSSTCIRHINLSTEGYTTNYTNSHRYENYFLFILQKYYKIFEKQWPRGKTTLEEDRTVYMSNIIEDDLGSFTLVSRTVGDYKRVRITVNKFNKLISNDVQCHAARYIDPILTIKNIEYRVIAPESVVDKYIQRMIADWMDGKVHDVFSNINLKSQSFLYKFVSYLRNIDNAIQTKLVKTLDNITGDPPLTVCCYVGISQLVEWCLDNFGCTDLGKNYEKEFSLYIACRQNDTDVVLILLKHINGPDVNTVSRVFQYKNMYESKSSGHSQILLQFFEEESIGGDNNWIIFESSLFTACKYGHTEIVSLLLAHKANEIDINRIRAKTDFANRYDTITPLYIACKGGHIQIVSLLLDHDVDVNTQTRELETPLFAACENGHKDIVSLLLAKCDQGLNITRFDGTTPLFAACREGHVEVVLTLLNYKGIDIYRCMHTGMSPLFIASFLGHTKIVEILVSRNASPYQFVYSKIVLNRYFARFSGCYPCFEKGILTVKTFIKYIRQVISYNSSESVKSYIDKMDNSWVFNLISSACPLNMACLMGHVEIVELLVNHTLNIKVFSQAYYSSSLFLACELGHEDIVRVLLSKNANPTLKREDGKTPVLIAIQNGHMKITLLILNHTFFKFWTLDIE